MQPCRILFWGKPCRDFFHFTSRSWCYSLVLTWSQSWMSCWLVVNATNTRTELAHNGHWASNRSSDGRNMDLIYGAWSDVKPLSFSLFFSSQGIKPDSFYKVKVPELKEIIGGCIRMDNDERYKRKQAVITNNRIMYLKTPFCMLSNLR